MDPEKKSILYDFNVFKGFEDCSPIKIFHVFRPAVNSNNYVFLITRKDQVYAFGHNRAGILGLGSESDPIEEHTLVEKLCGKQINQFFHFNSSVCMFALSDHNMVYGWGSNYSSKDGQTKEKPVKYLEPVKVDFFDDKNIVHMCGVLSNYLALSSNGEVYKWNDDCWGQSDGNNSVPSIISLFGPTKERIKFIDSSVQLEIAITESGKLYCTGRSFLSGIYKKDIHQMTLVEDKLRNIKVSKVVTVGYSLCVLSVDGNIHYSESIYPDLKFYRIETNDKFIDMFVDENHLLCQTEECVYLYQINQELIQTNYINFFEYYLEEYKATNVTTHIDKRNRLLFTKSFGINTNDDSYLIRSDQYLYREDNKFKKKFDNIQDLGKGSFGQVYSAEQNEPGKLGKICAIKKLWIGNPAPAEIFREFRFLEKMNSPFICKLITAWIEMQSTDPQMFAFIQMEYYRVDLEKVIKQKGETLNTSELLPLNLFISVEILKELTECIGYLQSFEKLYLKISDLLPGREELPKDRQPILHRDIKPANIMISDGSDGRYLKLADFGLTTIFHESSKIRGAGTNKYEAPEEYFGLYSDIYSLGKIGEDLISEINPIGFQSSDHFDQIKCHLETVNTIIKDMTETDCPSKRPDCEKIIDVLNKVTIGSQLTENPNWNQQKELMNTLNINKFFYDFVESKLNPAEAESVEPKIVSKIEPKDEPTLPPGSLESIDGLENVMQRLLGSVNSGLTKENMISMFAEMASCALKKELKEIPNLLKHLIDKAFNYCESGVVINEKRIESILKEWNNVLMALKALSFRLQMENDYLQTSPDDLTPLIYLKPSPNQTKDLPQVISDFETKDVSNGKSAIFEAVSCALFGTKDYTNVIRVLTFLRYFQFRDQFKQYCEIICENYQETLLKIITLPSKDQEIKEKFKLETTEITEEKSAILAIQLAIQRIVYFSGENSDRFNKFSINPFTRSFINERIIADPIWLSHNGNAFLTVKPINKDIDYTPEEYVPDPDLSPIFSNLNSCEESVSAMAYNFFSSYFTQIGGHQILPSYKIDEDLD